jgi:riboflavin synthase
MFTGIVEDIGGKFARPCRAADFVDLDSSLILSIPVVAELNTNDETGGTSLTISLPENSKLLSDANLGDSIAINGVCLTVTAFELLPAPSFKVGIAPETLRITNLGSLKLSSRVNLERAVRADTRMGGHFVQGHVDTTAAIASMTPDGNAITIRFVPAKLEVLRYVVYKGFIALDGTSLTVTKVDDAEGWWEVMLISYTQERVVIAQKQVGETVNVEVDVLAKYAEKSLAGYLGATDGAASIPLLEKMVEKIVAQGYGGKA